MDNINGKGVVVIGGASGVGAAVVDRYLNEGWKVCVVDIQEYDIDDRIINGSSHNYLRFTNDYTDEAAMEMIVQRVLKLWGKIYALVNCAGVSEQSDLLEMELTRWHRIFDIMVNGSILATKMAVQLFEGHGRIVHITSIHANRAEKGSSSYAMAKASIEQMCRNMALELADQNILVNAIAPGFVDTPMSVINGENELESEWFKDNYVNGGHLPLKRAARPEEIAGVVYFLTGPDSSYITGQVITVDGGLTITF